MQQTTKPNFPRSSERQRNPTVAVTGATGLVGSYIVKELLSKGYQVRAVTESVARAGHANHLFKFNNANTHLILHEAKLGDETSYQEAFAGCTAVFHTASPVKFDVSGDPEKELVEPATRGVISVLNAANKAGVQRVIFTSCMTAAAYTEDGKEHTYTEEDWSNAELMKEHKKWYHLSKYSAERAAWDFMQKGDRRFELLCLLPGMTIGPFFEPRLNASNDCIRRLINGEQKEIPNKGIFLTDVRDVARAHILLLEQESADSGRYLCVGDCLKWKDICDKLREIVPNEMKDKIPTNVAKGGYEPASASSKKLQKLGFQFSPINETFKDLVGFFKSQGLVEV